MKPRNEYELPVALLVELPSKVYAELCAFAEAQGLTPNSMIAAIAEKELMGRKMEAE